MRRCAFFAGAVFGCIGLFFLRGTHASEAVDGLPLKWDLGPYNVTFLEGGIGLSQPIPEKTSMAMVHAPWSVAGWARLTHDQPGTAALAVIGTCCADDGARDGWRGVLLEDGTPALALRPGVTLHATQKLEPGRWYALAATYDGHIARLYVDGAPVASAPGDTLTVPPTIGLAPATGEDFPRGMRHFGGSLALFSFASVALDHSQVRALAEERPDFSLMSFNQVGVGWPWQEHAWRGLQVPQDPATLPHARSKPSVPVATAPTAADTALRARGNATWTIDAWHLNDGPSVTTDGAALSIVGYPADNWYSATVPGTVLTTLIARGVYPDPDYGLNNLAIPDSLSRQDYWYRSVFTTPANVGGRDLTLTFNGINYAAEVWLNGTWLGSIRGAFTRGIFNVTGLVPGRRNALAVRISPPPHPGIPHEQSVAAGPGNNGGAMAIDGPTFIASEGWDWIPGIRDRNAGIWQSVELSATGALHIRDVHVVTHLPLPRIDSADLLVTVPIENHRSVAVAATVTARFDATVVRKTVRLDPGPNLVTLSPAEFSQLHLSAPRLWWPNGYGPANLYRLHIDVDEDGSLSDSADLRFGIRELTYELSLFDQAGRLRRVEADPTLGSLAGERLVDVRHPAIKRTPRGWAASLTAAGETSAAVRSVPSESLSPYLVIRVNGVPIAARGGSWGMDDSRKRIARDHLEPYFRLQREAHLNIIRNWLGQNTEEVFYDLADEYGLLVLNDFWISTQDFQMEPQDPALFLANARDVISRYRNHPSIAVWFGRNEGVPQPIINEGLADMIATLDGTRYYTGSSNSINLQDSGPYNYRPPVQYFTQLARGFSVEVGTPSLSTLESLQASIPAMDLWPLNDTYAYHDWHFGGNGDVATFMAAMADQYGPGTSLEDFERKAQLMNYVSYRAIFEGFQAHLWTQNSGRLLWMTHPSWPSNTWQLYSSDYDTAAAYYAVKKACEPIHAQMNLPTFELAVVNNTQSARAKLVLHSRVLSLDGRLLRERRDVLDARPNSVTTLPAPLDFAAAVEKAGLVLVKLTLTEPNGRIVSDNVYWQGIDSQAEQRLNRLPAQKLGISAHGLVSGDETVVTVSLANPNSVPVLNTKITVLDSQGNRVLPAYYSDNYVTLLAHESRELEVRCPAGRATCARVAVRGWNVVQTAVPIAGPVTGSH